MLIKNSKGKEKEVEVLLEVKKDNIKYIIYKDIDTSNIYASKYVDNLLKKIDKFEYRFLNKILEELKG